MRSEARKLVAEFYPQIEDDLKNQKISFQKAAEIFLHHNPIGFSPNTIKKYIIEHHHQGKKFQEVDMGAYKPVSTPQPDLSGEFNLSPKIDMELPATWSEERPKYTLGGFEKLGIMSDIHLPYHDVYAIQAAVSHLKEKEIDALLLNGDIMDFKSICHHTSRERAKTATLQQEIVVGRKFLTEIRKMFPHIPIYFKEGNHEVWLTMAVNKVPQLATLEGVDIPGLLKLKDYDIEYIPEWQIMTFGGLNIIHGHEVKLSGVNPARNLWLKTAANCLAGHVHRQSSQTYNSFGEIRGCWTTGCLSDLHPHYAGANPQAEHGCAIVNLLDKKMFHVDLVRIINGRII